LACYLALIGLAVLGPPILNYYCALKKGEAVAPSSDGCLSPKR